MTRSQLVLRVAELNPHLTLAQVEAAVRTVFGTMTDALVQGGRVELRDFGSFAVTQMEARPGRNPRTGAHVDVSARGSIRFKAGKAMRERVRAAAFRPSQRSRIGGACRALAGTLTPLAPKL